MQEQKSDFASKEEEEANFELLLKTIARLLPFNAASYKKSHLKRRIDVRVRILKCKTYKEYSDYLLKNPGEKQLLFETLAVNVTNFFRNPDCFKAIREEILPFIFAFKDEKKSKSIRIWSAGASSGEEIYSIAILLNELLGKSLSRYELTLVGTDIDTDALEKAKRGIYKEQQLRETDTKLIQKYFKKNADGDFVLSEDIKKMVSFSVHDMLTGPALNVFDLIVCRNVIIYFDKVAQDKLFRKFYSQLASNGFLVIGSSEVLPTELSKQFAIVKPAERIYQKI